MSVMQRMLFALCLIAVTAMAAGCGGGSSSSSSPEATSSAETSSEPAASESSGFLAEADEELAALYQGKFGKPPTSAPPHKKGVNIWVISCGEASQGCAETTAAAKKAGETLGWKMSTFDGKFGEGDAYNVGIRQAIAAGAEGIIMIGTNCDQATAGLQAAKAAGIYVVGSDGFDCTDPQVAGNEELFSAEALFSEEFPNPGEAFEERGRAKADWIIVHTKGKAKIINTDFAALTAGRYENAGFEEEIKKCTTCEVVKKIEFTPPDTANGVLKQEWSSALTEFPEANAGINVSDGVIVTAGMAQALQSAGRTKTFALVGSEGYLPAIELIREENGQSADTPLDQNWTSWSAVDAMIRVMDGEKAVPSGDGLTVVDKEHNLPPKGQAYKPPVDYEKLYEEAWGVR